MMKDDGHTLRIGFGRGWFPAREAHRLDVGCVIELDCAADACVDVCVNGRPRARGAAVVVDGKLCVRVQEVWHEKV